MLGGWVTDRQRPHRGSRPRSRRRRRCGSGRASVGGRSHRSRSWSPAGSTSTGAGRERDREIAVEARVRGRIARARPSWALWATRWQPTLSSRASVATTTSVVFASLVVTEDARRERRARVGRTGAGEHGPVGPDDVADRVHDRERDDDAAPSTGAGASPKPPATACSRPRHLPDRRARPAPTRPRAGGSPIAPRPRPRSPRPDPGAAPPDSTRSKIAAVGTIGTTPPAVAKPLAALGEEAHHAVGRGQARTPSRRSAPPRRLARPCASVRATRTRASRARHRAPRPSQRCPPERRSRSRRSSLRSSARSAGPRSQALGGLTELGDAADGFAAATAPTSRAKSVMSRSTSSVRSSMSM